MFATASTSHYETFGRAPAEALACGTVAIAPRYDGFVDVLAQPGGRLVDVEFEDDLPRANESMFLRAIYEALSSPVRVTADEISTVARERFCRPRTLRVLNYLSEAGFEAMTESNSNQIEAAQNLALQTFRSRTSGKRLCRESKPCAVAMHFHIYGTGASTASSCLRQSVSRDGQTHAGESGVNRAERSGNSYAPKRLARP